MKVDGTVSNSVKITHNTNGGPLLADGDHFGISMSAVDDLNGDGLADLMVGAFNDDTGGSDRGAVYLLFMQADGTAGSSLKIAHNTNGGPPLADGDWFGISVSDLGDLDGNGLPDLVSGVYQNSPGDFQGAVHVLFLDSVNPRLRVSKSVNDSTPQPGETITYTIIVTNTGLVNATGVVVSDTLPKGLNFVGPVRLDPPGKILPTPTFPVLASNLIITTNQAITLTFPVTLDLTAEGMITNIVAVASTEIITPVTATQVLNLGVTAGGGYETYLPLVVKDF
jgi:uncharacterized repeat protein (TIGR01451 family)